MKSRLLLGTTLLVISSAALWHDWTTRQYLRHPHVFFRYSCAYKSLHLSSDEPFETDLALKILAKVETKLESSPIFQPTTQHEAFLCQKQWCRDLYVGDRVGGLNYFPSIGLPFVFLRNARLYDNRLLSPSGRAIGGKRTLDYYITHEFTHTLNYEFARSTPPKWLDEGYADWVGLGLQSSYYSAAQDLRAAAPEVQTQMAADYLKYDLMVAHLLDRKKLDIRQLLENPPQAGEVERESNLP